LIFHESLNDMIGSLLIYEIYFIHQETNFRLKTKYESTSCLFIEEIEFISVHDFKDINLFIKKYYI
jgi:hypothetical protein